MEGAKVEGAKVEAKVEGAKVETKVEGAKVEGAFHLRPLCEGRSISRFTKGTQTFEIQYGN